MAGCFGKTCSCTGKRIYAKHQEPKRLKHIFRVYYFRRARTCFVCKQLVWNQGCACKVCRYICHRKCESKVMTSCVPQVNHELSNETFGKTTTTSQPLSVNVSDNHNKGVMTTLRDMINRGQDPGGDQNRVSMDLTYITERLLSMSFPHEGHDSSYKASLKDVNQMMRMKHSDKYLVINISEKKADLTKLSPKVLDYGWPDHLAPPLERLCSICKSIDSWLSSDSQHVVVIHCKGARGKIAVIVAAYMHYCNICANADQELDRLAMQRFYNDKLGQFTKPSQRRYVNYFAGLLSGAIKINSNPLYLHHILIHGVANFDTKGGCRPFIKVYQAMQPVFTSGVYNVTENMQKVCISISPGIPLRGDILIKCYHKKSSTGQREPMWQSQFHTCAISNYKVIFGKDELDQGRDDPRFPDNGKIEFVFGPKSDTSVPVSGFKSDVTVPVDDGGEGLVRWDSYENFNQLIENLNDINENAVTKTTTHKVLHAQGPVDGSLYAQVNKTRKTDNQVIMQNGPTHLPNGGSHTSSVDSGIESSGIHTNINTSGSSYMTTEVRNYNTNLNTSKSSYNSVSSKQTVKPLDEKSQLDDLLSDLLKDQANLTETSTGGTKVANTKSFTTYSSVDVDSNKSPTFTDDKTDQSAIHRAEVTYKLPGFKEETKHYTIKATMDDKMFPPTSPSSERRTTSEAISKMHTLPYRTDYENKYPAGQGYRTMDGSYSSWSDSEQTSSWLQEQQNKLQERKDREHRSPQAKQLVAELKTAQNKYMKTKAESEAEEQALMNKYNAMNGPASGSYNYYYKSETEQPFSYSQGYSAHYTTSTSGTKPPPSPGTQRSYTPTPQAPVRSSSKDYMQRNRSNSATSWNVYNKPLQRQASDGAFDQHDRSYTYLSRSRSQTSPPKSPPRSFSPTQVGYTTYSYSSSSQRQDQQVRPPPPQNVAPPPAPPPVNYVTEVFVHRSPGVQKKEILVQDDKPDSTRLEELERTLQAASASISQPQSLNTSFTMKEDYSTRRSEKQFYETHTQNKFDQSVSNQQPPIVNSTHVHCMSPTWDNYNFNYVTQHQTEIVSKPEPPPPKQYREIEEERIALKPIGAGVHVLEPEGGTGTISRHTSRPPTPCFPTSPVQSAEDYIKAVNTKVTNMMKRRSSLHVTPPFPVSQRTPFVFMNSVPPAFASSTPINVSPPTPRTPIEPERKLPPRELFRVPDPLYATITEDADDDVFLGGSNVVSPTGVSYTQQTVSYQQQQQVNQQGGGGGGQIVSPTGTLVQGPGTQLPPTQIVSPTGTLQQGQGYQQQQQYQTQQQQQFQTQQQQQNIQNQQYSTQSNQQFSGSQGGTLHVDTSGRGYSQTSPRSFSSTGSPPSPGSFHTLKQQLTTAHTMSGAPGALSPTAHTYGGQSSPSVYFGLSRRGSLSSLAEVDMITTPKFVKDTSKYWYKPNITREDAINLLKEASPGTFVIRDSNSFPGAFGLALKVAQIPPNVQTKSTGDPQADLVRHFLIEPTPKGVRLRGCSNEPVFGSLAALVYQHSITPLALPCKLHLPEADATVDSIDTVDSVKISADIPGSAAALLAQGAACNVIYLNSVDTESLTGPQAVAMAVKTSFAMDLSQKTTVVHFKVSNQGITLTDNQRRLFFRRHYPVSAVTYCGMDPEDRRFSRETEVMGVKVDAKIFGYVARKQGGVSDNACHLFAELDPEQPASAIVNFVTKVMIGHGSKVKS